MHRNILTVLALTLMTANWGFADECAAKADKGELLQCGSHVQVMMLENAPKVQLLKLESDSSVTELPCTMKNSATTLMECSDPSVVDVGYRVKVMQPGFTGMKSVVVTQLSFAGASEVLTANCGKMSAHHHTHHHRH